MMKISDKAVYRSSWAVVILAPIIVVLQVAQGLQTIEGVAFYVITAMQAWKYVKDAKRKREESEALSNPPPQA